MNIKNIFKKINNSFFCETSSEKGIALLFSIMLSAIFFTIAIGVLNIALKELNFSTSAKDTNNAFFAADSGVECALYNDKTDSIAFTGGSNGEVYCFNGNITMFDNTYPDFSFVIDMLGSNNNSCAEVNILKTPDLIDPTIISTRITSKGYSEGRDDGWSGKCATTGASRIERVLEVNY